MSLRYSFRHLFYGGKIQKERLYKVLEDLDAKESTGGSSEVDTSEIESAVSSIESTLTNLLITLSDSAGSDLTESERIALIKTILEALEDNE